ncbi:MAG: DUF1788 domain-containing protein [Spirochaetaceae bacterium]|nr:MAG: DUF1788 domain-containing protein [Spirochaetaceae bacterium]
MHSVETAKRFDRVYQIISHPRFLARQGLGNEVPYFIETYEPANEFAVTTEVRTIHERLLHNGIPAVLLPMYDIVIECLESDGRLAQVFEKEPAMPKWPDPEAQGRQRTFFAMLDAFTRPDAGKPVHDAIVRRLDAVPDHKLVLMHQLGTVFPFLRTHTLLTNLHSTIYQVPLVAFFPGTYVSSDRDGFYLSLFGTFKGDYYRAFQLSDYIERGQIRADIE